MLVESLIVPGISHVNDKGTYVDTETPLGSIRGPTWATDGAKVVVVIGRISR
jgi:hypothetical protein